MEGDKHSFPIVFIVVFIVFFVVVFFAPAGLTLCGKGRVNRVLIDFISSPALSEQTRRLTWQSSDGRGGVRWRERWGEGGGLVDHVTVKSLQAGWCVPLPPIHPDAAVSPQQQFWEMAAVCTVAAVYIQPVYLFHRPAPPSLPPQLFFSLQGVLFHEWKQIKGLAFSKECISPAIGFISASVEIRWAQRICSSFQARSLIGAEIIFFFNFNNSIQKLL